jgi:drug/metabolite transporter (DMT)-like permease
MRAAAQSSIFHPLAILPPAIWGGTWIALKISRLGGGEFAFARAFFGGAALLLVALALRRPLAIPRRLVPTLALMSLTFGGFFGLAFAGAERLPAALGSLLGNIAPVSTIVLAALILRERPTVRQYLGVAVAFLGVLVIAYPKLGHTGDIIAIGLMLAGAVMQSVNTLCMKHAIELDQLVVNAIQGTVGGLVILAAVAATGNLHPIEPSAPVIASLAYVAIVATAFAQLLWSRVLTLFSASAASMIIFMVPVFGHIWSWSILREPIDPIEVAGAVLVIGGMVVAAP